MSTAMTFLTHIQAFLSHNWCCIQSPSLFRLQWFQCFVNHNVTEKIYNDYIENQLHSGSSTGLPGPMLLANFFRF